MTATVRPIRERATVTADNVMERLRHPPQPDPQQRQGVEALVAG